MNSDAPACTRPARPVLDVLWLDLSEDLESVVLLRRLGDEGVAVLVVEQNARLAQQDAH